MPIEITNQMIADAFNEIANVLEEQEESLYRIRAYRRAASAIRKYPINLADLVENQQDLTQIPYVGKKLAEVARQMIATGNFTWRPKANPPLLYPEHLAKRKYKPRSFKIYTAMLSVDKIIERLRKLEGIEKCECVGEFRRRKEVLNEIVILITGSAPALIFHEFHLFPSIQYLINTELNSTTVQLKTGIRVTLIHVGAEEYTAYLLALTGSTEHYELLQQEAEKLEFTLTQNGLYKNQHQFQLNSEHDFYKKLHLPYIPPELRENRGEIIAAKKNILPTLVELKDIKGDLHCHTNETDGYFSLEEMVEAARQQGYEYLAVTDHTQSLKITNGMDEKRVLKRIQEIDKLNSKLSNFTILKGMEVDILEDGSLDLSNDVLKELDLTVCSVHSKFRLPLEQQTERVLRAMDNPYFTILGHATGRLINHRPPYQIDIEKILKAAKERNCFIEVNAQPARLDINDWYCMQAKKLGVKVAISSDAHSIAGFEYMILGVNQARRGWLEAKDVINTYSLLEFKNIIKK